jgi:phosphoribosyl 1,2-cyclic phosphodiesterase
MRTKIWGCRGSLPTAITADMVSKKVKHALRAASGQNFANDLAIEKFMAEELDFPTVGTFGGNSSCVEIDMSGDGFMVCDMGSGLRGFGIDSLHRIEAGEKSRVYNIFLSHFHWDHIMGFPFFAPAFDPRNTIRIHGAHKDIDWVLDRQQQDPCFPVPLEYMGAKLEFITLEPGKDYDIAGYRVTLIEQYHHGTSYGFRFEKGGKTAVYSTDSEHKLEAMDKEQRFVDFFDEADIVIFDTMYSLADTVSVKEDWGHSSNAVAVDLCHLARARRLCMFHHEPVYDDQTIHNLHQETIRYEELIRQANVPPLEILCAYDGMEVTL